MTRTTITMLAAAVTLAGVSTAALAQRDPAYAADDAEIAVGGGDAQLRALVSNINIQRKAAYTQKAQASGATVEQLAFTSGCNLIGQTQPGEKYRTPAGTWETRGSGAPTRDPRCV